MSFIGSLAAVGTAVGVSGAIAAPLAGAGVLAAGGAALGAGTSAAMGGDPGEGALMGAVTAPFMAPLMPAAGAGGAAAEAGTQAATQAGTQAAADASTQAATQAAMQTGANVAENVGTNVAENVGTQSIEQLAPKAAYNMADEQLLYAGADRAATNAAIKAGATDAMQGIIPEVGWGQNAVADIARVGPRSLAAKIGGNALEQGVYGAGIGALGSGMTGQDPLQGAGLGFVSGGIGGAASTGLASQAGQPGVIGKLGTMAANNPGMTSAAIGLPTSMALNSLTAPDQPEAPGIQYPNIDPNKFKYTAPQWQVYQPKYYAGGGITDLDAGNGIPPVQMMAEGGISDLGGYSDGGRLLKGPGDGVSDDIPAQIGEKQPARLADGEFVIPSRIVSELGNGSTDAGAKRLYQMMDRINSGRAATTKKGKFAEDTKAYKHLPA